MWTILFLAIGVGFLWLGADSWHKNSVGTHYNATVVACHGGRYNSCDISVQTHNGVVAASANLQRGANAGDTVRVIAEGPPPSSAVTQLENPLAGPIIVGMFLISALGFGFVAMQLWFVHRRIGLRHMFSRESPR